MVTGSNPVRGAINNNIYKVELFSTLYIIRRDARVDEWNGLENRRGATHPGFESLSLRHLSFPCDKRKRIGRKVTSSESEDATEI